MREQDTSTPPTPTSAPELEISDLRSGQPLASTARPRSLRRRLAIAILLAATLLAIVAGILFSIPHTWDTLYANFVPTPTPTAPLYDSDARITIAHSVPWGSLRIDGAPVDITISKAQIFHPHTLTRGSHHLVYTAPPFPALACQLSAPARKNDTCPLVSPSTSDNTGRTLDLRSTPDRLPPAQFNALAATVAATFQHFDGATALLANERYRTAAGVVTASRPLTATFHYRLNHDPLNALPISASPGQNTAPCVTFCPNSPFTTRTDLTAPRQNRSSCSTNCPTPNATSAPDLGPAWNINANILFTWDYTTPAGDTISADAPAAPPSITSAALIPIAVVWRSGWLVAIPYVPDAPQCNIALSYLNSILSVAPPTASSIGNYATTVPPHLPAQGCLIEIGPTGADNHFASPPSYILYRFGLLIAANQIAAQTFPNLPYATPDEVQLAQQLAQQLDTQPYPPQFRT